jgi:3-oxoacyl-[acyl-carrier protein] reductase
MSGEPLDASAFLLTDRVAIVTGAAQGIGEAIALAFARAGADVALCDRDEEGLEATAAAVVALDRRSLISVMDVRDPDAVAAFVATIGATFGRVDVLVNNAGGGFRKPFLSVSTNGEDALVRENFTSVTAFVRAAVPLMPPPSADGGRTGGGSIITITSIEAHRAGPEFAVYSAMKAAVANLTMTLALELGSRHIRVNAIAPDVIPTPGIGTEMPVTTPLPYAGHVDDVAAAAVYLASGASSFVTGTTLHVDGGNRAAGGWRRDADGSFTTH